MLTAPDIVLPDTAMPVLPVTATLSVGSVDAALAPVTPASPTTQAATMLVTTTSDPNRFTTMLLSIVSRQRTVPSPQGSKSRPPTPPPCPARPTAQHPVGWD